MTRDDSIYTDSTPRGSVPFSPPHDWSCPVCYDAARQQRSSGTLYPPMQPRTRAIPWQQLVQSIVYTLCGIALIAGLLWIGAPK